MRSGRARTMGLYLGVVKPAADDDPDGAAQLRPWVTGVAGGGGVLGVQGGLHGRWVECGIGVALFGSALVAQTLDRRRRGVGTRAQGRSRTGR